MKAQTKQLAKDILARIGGILMIGVFSLDSHIGLKDTELAHLRPLHGRANLHYECDLAYYYSGNNIPHGDYHFQSHEHNCNDYNRQGDQDLFDECRLLLGRLPIVFPAVHGQESHFPQLRQFTNS